MNRNLSASARHAPFFGVMAAHLVFWFAFATIAAEPIIITSVSKQFVVRGLPQSSAFAASAREDFVYLDPSTVAITCERVKQTLARELGWGVRWRGLIYVNIHPIRFDNEPPDIVPLRTDRGWSFRIDLPSEIARARLLETIIETLLLEFAQREAREAFLELPPWLVEGLTAHLSQGPLAGAALQARSLRQIAEEPQLRASRTVRHMDVDQLLRQRLQANGALTVDQLNWPEFDDNDQDAVDAYHHSAHLFVRELLRLRGGPDALSAMLATLPRHLNWQTAFLRGFEPHFRRMLDVEKWWSVTLMQMKSHDSSTLWSSAETQQKFEEILYTPLEVRLTSREEPHVTPVALQTVLNDWTFQQQAALLQTKVVQLQIARMRCTPELAGLADAYRAALEKYLFARTHTGRWFVERKTRTAITGVVAELNALDEQRSRLANQMFAAKAAAARSSTPE
jgi:hypothetical protein